MRPETDEPEDALKSLYNVAEFILGGDRIW
jgi:hypothetical protein